MMKMLPLTDSEKALIHQYRDMKYPPIYKMDRTDRILFAELVDFSICAYLLGEETMDYAQYKDAMNEYERYLMQTDLVPFDAYTKKHYDFIVAIMDMFKKYYNMKNAK